MKASNLTTPRTLAACQFVSNASPLPRPGRRARNRAVLGLMRALLSPFTAPAAPLPDMVWHSKIGQRVRYNGHPHMVTGAQRVADNPSLLRYRLLPLGGQVEIWSEPRPTLEAA